jgi:uncharacterized protein YbjT (DUF2867 family)
MPAQFVTVFGGTGFLGRRIVRHLHDTGFAVRIASRHPDRASSIFPGAGSRIESVHGDINDDGSVAAAVTGVFAVVNAVSLYVDRGKDTFQSVHVDATERVARLARGAGAERFLHISGIGADTRSESPYIRSRGKGEAAVLGAFPSATLLRPAVMFGPEDAFVTPLLRMLGRLPVFPMFGDGEPESSQPMSRMSVRRAHAYYRRKGRIKFMNWQGRALYLSCTAESARPRGGQQTPPVAVSVRPLAYDRIPRGVSAEPAYHQKSG